MITLMACAAMRRTIPPPVTPRRFTVRNVG